MNAKSGVTSAPDSQQMRRLENELEQIKSMLHNQPDTNAIKVSTYDALQGLDEAATVQTVEQMLEGDHSQDQIRKFV